MTEQEIIDCLRENKSKGVAFVFMPKEVKEWACDNSRFIIYYNKFGWDNYSSNIEICRPTDIIALPEDFELKEKLQGGWVEFEIEDSCFSYSHSVGTSHLFDWFDWGFFLKASKKQGWGFTDFGGWLYDKNGGGDWVLSPQVGLIDDSGNAPFILNQYSHTYEKERITPAIPVKIRFWREA